MTTTTALPIRESDVIVVGTLAEATAFLSENKNTVYSEFKILVEKVFKMSPDVILGDSKDIHAERDGGIVLYPNGFKLWYFVSGQTMPSIGERYLFFLTHNFPSLGHQKGDLYLLTAYRLKGGIVTPLDFAEGGTHPTAKYYRGKSEEQLFIDLVKALEPHGSIVPKKGEGQ